MDNDKCDRCGTNKEELLKWQNDCMEKVGWYAHYVIDKDEQSPTGFNAHTHGLPESFNHLDLQIIISMPPNLAHNIFFNVVEEIVNGTIFEENKISDKILKNYNVTFRKVKECNREVLRIILPDKDNNVLKDEIKEPYNIQWL
jgi:hypothetical protein